MGHASRACEWRTRALRGVVIVGFLACLGTPAGAQTPSDATLPIINDDSHTPAPPRPSDTDERAARTAPNLTDPLFEEEAPDVFELGVGFGLASGSQSDLIAVGGYIDSALIQRRFRLRYDSAYNNPIPDRNQFFYPEDGPGALAAEVNLDLQDIRMYLEHPLSSRLSIFAELPIRFTNPEVNANTAGLGDMNAGFKFALWDRCDEVLTFQFRTYVPTGDWQFRGLGVGFASLEPSLLYHRQLSDRATLFGEFRGWIPLNNNNVRSGPFIGEDFSGEMLRWGIGAGYDLFPPSSCCNTCCSRCDPRLTAVAEVVGWSILDGFGTVNGMVQDVEGDSIVNLKLGGRWTSARNSFFVGWGHALTSDTWYENILRAEFETRF